MSLAYDIVGVLLALAVLGSAAAKLSRSPKLVENFTGLGVPPGSLPFLAACEIAGAAGLVIGIWYAPLGIAAAVGLVLYFVGAVVVHLRKSDFKGLPSPAVLLGASLAALILGAIAA